MKYVECSVMNMKTNTLIGRYSKQFDQISDFTAWYKIVKTDYDTIINIMTYSPQDFPGQKDVFDAKLLRVPRSLPV